MEEKNNPLPLHGEAAERNPALALDVNADVARAVHRVVRAMHDGECPRCHDLFDSRKMVDHPDSAAHTCPSCGFKITYDDARAAMELFAPYMERALEVFERWRLWRSGQGELLTPDGLADEVARVWGVATGYADGEHPQPDAWAKVVETTRLVRLAGSAQRAERYRRLLERVNASILVPLSTGQMTGAAAAVAAEVREALTPGNSCFGSGVKK